MSKQDSAPNPDRKNLAEVLSELKAEYLEAFPSKLEKLKKLTHEQDWLLLAEEYHKLKGTGKTYGYPEISIVCEKLENLAQNKAHQRPELFGQALILMENLYTSYRNQKSIDLKKDPIAKSILNVKL